MLKLNFFDKALSKLIGLLESVGKILNQTPTKEENESIRQSPLMRAKLWEKNESKKSPVRKPSVKNASSRRKGKRDTATETFNHPRKDFHA